MFSDHLKSYSDGSAADVKQQLGELDKVISADVDSKMWSYMETRAALLLKAYETSIEVNYRLGVGLTEGAMFSHRQ